jgi:hypothetical protein
MLMSQGVDTIMFPRAMLQQHADSPEGVLTLQRVLEAANFYHKTCPQSFFQDDYVISAILFASQISVRSVWSGSRVAMHVNDVSTSLQQMHLSVNVFDREEATKQCVEDEMSHILHIMHGDAGMHGISLARHAGG